MAKAIKVRNNGTMTESAFWGFIRSSLRKRTIVWKPIQQAKILARRPYTGGLGRFKWEYKCAKCGFYFHEPQIEVDHIVEAGSLKSAEDLKGFVERLFCEVDGLAILCRECHNNKTYKKDEPI